MASSYDKLLDSVRATLLIPTDQGISPGEVKRAIIHLLSPYFVNQDILEEFAIPILAPEAVNITRITADDWSREMFRRVLQDYHNAAEIDAVRCFRGCARWNRQILHGSSEYVSIFYLHRDLDELPLDEFSYEVFRGIGALIEASLQPYLRELLQQIRIRRMKLTEFRELEEMDLGSVVNELWQHSGYEGLFAPPPWEIRLNQWRNMAQHHRTRVVHDRIVGTYHSGGNQRQVVLTREELLSCLKRIHSILSLMKGARSVFLMDRIDEARPHFADEEVPDVRTDVMVFNLASSLATQGFDLRDLMLSERSVTAIVQDVTDTPLHARASDYERMRMIHSSQFVYVLWTYFPQSKMTIKHLDIKGDLRCTISGKGTDCEAVSSGNLPFEELAGRVVYDFGKSM